MREGKRREVQRGVRGLREGGEGQRRERQGKRRGKEGGKEGGAKEGGAK